MKTEIHTRFSLRDEGWLIMSAQEALRLAKDLSMAIKLQMAEEATEGKASKLVKGSSFSIWRTTESALSIVPDTPPSAYYNRIELNIEQAKAVVQYLEKAPRMIAFVDSLIHF